MKRCCIESLALKGIADGFQLTPEGGSYACDVCQAHLQIVEGHWRELYKCPHCGAVSFNPHDREHKYCGRCHAFEEL